MRSKVVVLKLFFPNLINRFQIILHRDLKLRVVVKSRKVNPEKKLNV
jgi:hypothetical protein